MYDCRFRGYGRVSPSSPTIAHALRFLFRALQRPSSQPGFLLPRKVMSAADMFMWLQNKYQQVLAMHLLQFRCGLCRETSAPQPVTLMESQ